MKKLTFYFTIIFSITIFSIGCKQEPEAIPTDKPLNVVLPQISLSIEKIKVTQAFAIAKIIKNGNLTITSYGFVWDTLPNPTESLSTKVEIKGRPNIDSFSIRLTGLKAEKIYNVRSFVSTLNETIYSENKAFLYNGEWVMISNLPKYPFYKMVAFNKNSIVFTGGGTSNKFWSYNATIDSWVSRNDLLLSGEDMVGFAIGDTGYIATGYKTGTLSKSFAAYTEQGGWAKKKDFEGAARRAAVGFSLKGKGYIGLGEVNSTSKFNDFWMYNPSSDSWLPIPDFPGEKRSYAISFVINEKAYIGFGRNENFSSLNDIWEFDPTNSNPWKQIVTNLIIPSPRYAPFVFVVKNSAYIGGGSRLENDFWQFTPSTPNILWKKLGTVPFTNFGYSTGVELGDKGMIIGGDSVDECWLYYPDL